MNTIELTDSFDTWHLTSITTSFFPYLISTLMFLFQYYFLRRINILRRMKLNLFLVEMMNQLFYNMIFFFFWSLLFWRNFSGSFINKSSLDTSGKSLEYLKFPWRNIERRGMFFSNSINITFTWCINEFLFLSIFLFPRTFLLINSICSSLEP